MKDLIIDLELGKKLVGNETLAKELLTMLVKDLPLEFALIEKTFLDKDYAETIRYLHKLRGALSYCGVPRLKTATLQLEHGLQKNQPDVDVCFMTFKVEVELLLKRSFSY